MALSSMEGTPPTARLKRTMALVNPKAGTSTAQQEFLPCVEQAGGTICHLSSGEALQTILAAADRDGIERLIVVGGDGSISGVINSLALNLNRFEIAIVPAGTGNDLARSLGIPVDDLGLAWQLALHAEATPIDLIQLSPSGRLFANSITAGFGGQQASDVDREQKGYWGKLAYWLTALGKMGDMKDFHVAITTPEFAKELTVYGFWVANGRTVGGGFTVTPAALVDDGLLDVVAIPAGGPLDLLSAGVDYAVIGPEQSEQILTFRAKNVRILVTPTVALSVDGEPFEAEYLECAVLPSAVRMIVGPVDPALSKAPPPPITPT